MINSEGGLNVADWIFGSVSMFFIHDYLCVHHYTIAWVLFIIVAERVLNGAFNSQSWLLKSLFYPCGAEILIFQFPVFFAVFIEIAFSENHRRIENICDCEDVFSRHRQFWLCEIMPIIEERD